MKKRKVTWLNVLGYASINFLGSGAQAVVSAWLMIFYTSLCGISAAAAGSIFAAARLIDAVGNPVMGYVSDNFGKTSLGKKFGRRRFFILLGAPSMLIIFPILWTVGHSFTFYFVANLIFEMSMTMTMVAATTLPAEMSQESADKTKLVAGKQYCGTVASFVSTFIPGLMFQMFGDNNPQAFFLTGLVYGIILAISLSVAYLFTFERDPKDIVYAEDSNHGIGHILVKMVVDVGSSMQNRSFRLHACMMFFIGIYKNLAAGVFGYFALYVLGASKTSTAYITSFTTLTSLIALTLYIAIAYKSGGPKTFRIAAVIIIASMVGYFALTKMDGSPMLTIFLVVFALINNFGKAGADYVPVFQLPFMADIDEAITGQRREGIYTGVNSLLSKVASAIESAVLGIGLTYFGFVKNAQTQTLEAINGILIVTLVIPAIFIVLTWLVSLRFNLTKESHKLLVDEVNRVKAGGDKALVTIEAKKAIEELTGWKYEECFGNNNVGYHNKNNENVASV